MLLGALLCSSNSPNKFFLENCESAVVFENFILTYQVGCRLSLSGALKFKSINDIFVTQLPPPFGQVCLLVIQSNALPLVARQAQEGTYLEDNKHILQWEEEHLVLSPIRSCKMLVKQVISMQVRSLEHVCLYWKGSRTSEEGAQKTFISN